MTSVVIKMGHFGHRDMDKMGKYQETGENSHIQANKMTQK